MDMQRALEKLRSDYPNVVFEELKTFGPVQTYGMTADGPSTGVGFHFLITNEPSPLCLYRHVAMCCQAMK